MTQDIELEKMSNELISAGREADMLTDERWSKLSPKGKFKALAVSGVIRAVNDFMTFLARGAGRDAPGMTVSELGRGEREVSELPVDLLKALGVIEHMINSYNAANPETPIEKLEFNTLTDSVDLGQLAGKIGLLMKTPTLLRWLESESAMPEVEVEIETEEEDVDIDEPMPEDPKTKALNVLRGM